MSTNNYLFNLYKQVQNKNRQAEIKLIELHKKKFPNSTLHELALPGASSDRYNILHTMYLHLTR